MKRQAAHPHPGVLGHAVALVQRGALSSQMSQQARARNRPVQDLEGHDTPTPTVDSASVANDVGKALLEVTSPLSPTALYTTTRSSSSTTGINLESTGVCKLFLLDGSAMPRGLLRRDR
jgi:hypothetical protein